MQRAGGHADLKRARIGGIAAVAIALLTMMLAPALAVALPLPATPVVPPAPLSSTAPTLTGTPALGQTLTCSTGAWANSPTNFSYTWLRGGTPIAGQAGSTYVVQAADQGHAIACKVTAANVGGNYTITGLSSGSYKVSFFADQEGLNYLPQYFSGKVSYKEANLVSVTMPGATGGVNAELHAGGQITGRVIGASTHAALANVLACASENGEGGSGGCAETNGNGEYAIGGLPSGTYVVEFFPLFEEGYLGQYYSGKATASEATRVGVAPGSATANINAELQTGGGISGRVTDTSADPLEKIEVCAFETTNSSYSGCASTNGNGEYTITGLPTSSYEVEFAATADGANYAHQFWNGKASIVEAEAVVINAPGTTPNINATMQAGGQISGTVTDASSHAPLSKIEVCASYGPSRCSSTKSNGEYTITGLATGSYTIHFTAGAEGGNYLDQYWNGKTSSSTAEAVSVTQGATYKGKDAEMQAGGGVAGTVTDADSHAPIGNAEVCATGGAEGSGRGCTSTNANGEYAIFQLESGPYTVAVSDDQEGSNYIRQVVGGVSVLAPGVASAVNVELHSGGQISGLVTDAATHAGIAGIEVCADPASVGGSERCASTAPGTASANATSNSLAVPSGNFIQVKKPVFDAKKGVLDFFFKFPTAGKVSWALFFRNSDVGFADSLGLSLQASGNAADLNSTQGLAELARRSRKSKKCRKGYTKHGRRCLRLLVPFGSGSQDVAAGTVEIKVHASSKAIKALKAGRTLHVSGTFTFQSALGGPAIRKVESSVVRLPKRVKHHKGKRR